MYRKILVALDRSVADESLIPHISKLARLLGSELLLLHVAEGWVARNYDDLQLAESDEMKSGREYLEAVATRLRAEGLKVTIRLGLGSPPSEVLRAAEIENCDLIAMTTHGHRLVGDLFYGSTIDKVRHSSNIPLLVVRSAKGPAAVL